MSVVGITPPSVACQMYVYLVWISGRRLPSISCCTRCLIPDSCSALFESIRNHILTMKHRRMTVGEYIRTDGLSSSSLPPVLATRCKQPIRRKMLKRIDSYLQAANLWARLFLNKTNLPRVSFILIHQLALSNI
jgi:hypothetical protein